MSWWEVMAIVVGAAFPLGLWADNVLRRLDTIIALMRDMNERG